MDYPLTKFDWSLVQSFLTVAETGSLSAAARVLGQSQPTLGRHVQTIEQTLGASLFHRHARGFELTETGAALLAPARAMRAAAGQIALAAAARDQRPEGPVRITASVIVAHFVLPAIIADILEAEPGLSIDLVASDETGNLLFREADIALRMYRPEQLDVITAHVANLPLGLFAAKSYLSRHGRPETLEEALQHRLVGYDTDRRLVDGMAAMGITATRESFRARTDDQAANWQLIRAGAGIGFGQVAAARGDPAIERLLPDLPVPPLPVWLTAHQAMRTTPRIRRVWDILAEALPRAVS